ncbi:IS21-like element ISFK1 family helper ATPase IstB, partial [Klebsiella pneumoniae]
MARLDGRFPRLIDKLTRVQLLVLDDWGSHGLTEQQRGDLLGEPRLDRLGLAAGRRLGALGEPLDLVHPLHQDLA